MKIMKNTDYRDTFAAELGLRTLPSHLQVHHIDGDISNNDMDNLALVTKKGHTFFHDHMQVEETGDDIYDVNGMLREIYVRESDQTNRDPNIYLAAIIVKEPELNDYRNQIKFTISSLVDNAFVEQTAWLSKNFLLRQKDGSKLWDKYLNIEKDDNINIRLSRYEDEPLGKFWFSTAINDKVIRDGINAW